MLCQAAQHVCHALQADMEQLRQTVAALQRAYDGCEGERSVLEREVLAGIERLLFERPLCPQELARQLADTVMLEDIGRLIQQQGWQDRQQAQGEWRAQGDEQLPANAPAQLDTIDDQQTQQERAQVDASSSDANDSDNCASDADLMVQSSEHELSADENDPDGMHASVSASAASEEASDDEEASADQEPAEAGGSLPGSNELTFAPAPQRGSGSAEPQSKSEQHISAPEDNAGANGAIEAGSGDEDLSDAEEDMAPSIAPSVRTRNTAALRHTTTSTRANASRHLASQGAQRPQRTVANAQQQQQQQGVAVVQGGLKQHVTRNGAGTAQAKAVAAARGAKAVGQKLAAKARQQKKVKGGKKTGAVRGHLTSNAAKSEACITWVLVPLQGLTSAHSQHCCMPVCRRLLSAKQRASACV